MKNKKAPLENAEITPIATSFIQPALDLYWTLSTTRHSGTSLIRVSSHENGYASSVITLITFCIESLIAKIKYHKKDASKSALKFFLRTYEKTRPRLCAHLKELFTIRDIIAHSYIWVIKYRFDENFEEIDIRKDLMSNYGSPLFDEVVDLTTKETKILHMRIIPTRIGLDDAKKALGILVSFSHFLDEIKMKLLSNQSWKFGGKNITIGDIENMIK